MNNLELHSQIQRLRSLVKRSLEACADNPELQSHWARYLTVLSAGLLENGLKEIYSDYAVRNVSRPVAKYVNSHLSSLRNPKADRFLEVAGAFRDAWRVDLQNFLETDGRGEAIDSIMNNRHLVSHGKYIDSRISVVQFKEYFEKAVAVLEYIEMQCKS